MCMERKVSDTLEGVNQHAEVHTASRLQFPREGT
jgi:hypothetical protein